MGKAFKRLEKQVQDRSRGLNRVVSWDARIRHTEVFLLELGSYLQLHVATDMESAADAALVAAYTDFKVHLEGTIK